MSIHSFSLLPSAWTVNFRIMWLKVHSPSSKVHCVPLICWLRAWNERAVAAAAEACLSALSPWSLSRHLADGRLDETQTDGVWRENGWDRLHRILLPASNPSHAPRHSEGQWLSLDMPLWVRNTCGASLLDTNQTKKYILSPPSLI